MMRFACFCVSALAERAAIVATSRERSAPANDAATESIAPTSYCPGFPAVARGALAQPSRASVTKAMSRKLASLVIERFGLFARDGSMPAPNIAFLADVDSTLECPCAETSREAALPFSDMSQLVRNDRPGR